MKKVVIYTRVSTDDQKENGFSLQDQEERLRRECRRKGYEIIKHYQDDHSAKTFNRPAFNAFLEDINSKRIKPNIFLCVRYDRFSRNATDSLNMHSWFKTKGTTFETLEQNYDLSIPENFLPYIIQLAIPQMDNERRGLNTKSGMRQALKQGRWMWKAPVGYVNAIGKKEVLVDEKMGPLVKEAFETFSTGLYSAEQIRVQLLKRGLKITKQNFLNALRNPFYIGKIRIDAWRDEPEQIVNALHPPLIDETLFNTCQDILTGKKKRISRLNTRRENLPLRGFLSCSRCGHKLTGSNSKSRNGSLHSYYHCQHGCKERFRADLANELFIEHLHQYEIGDDVQELYLAVLSDVFKANDEDRTKERKQISEQIEALDSRITSLNDKFIDGLIDHSTYKDTKERYETAKSEFVSKHIALQPEGSALKKYLTFSLCLSKNLSKFYTKADFEGKQEIVGSIFPDNLIFEGKKYRTTRVNETFELISAMDKGLAGNKNKKVGILADLSSWAPPAGLKPATL